MTEYMRETGGKITSDTRYKGYNLGSIKNNLRQMYYNGTLKMEQELLQQFIESGIIVEEKEKVRTSQQDKYDFLMSLVGKSNKEQEQAKMENGLSYTNVKNQLQINYNSGKLNLNPDQIENLRKNGFLTYSKEELEQLAAQCELPRQYAVNIIKEYGSYETFLEKYKKREIGYYFGKDVFCGYRGTIISEQEMTEKQKLGYGNLLKDLIGLEQYDEVIDIDEIKPFFDTLPERNKQIIQMFYGLEGEKLSNFTRISELFGLSRSGAHQILLRTRNKLGHYIIRKNEFINLGSRLKKYESEYRDIQENMNNLNVIVSYITDESGKIKSFEDIEDMEIKNGIISGLIEDFDKKIELKTLKNVIRYFKSKTPTNLLEWLNLSVRTFNTLERNGIYNIYDLTQKTEEQLFEMRNMGRRCVDEIIEKLAEKGLRLRQEDEIINNNGNFTELEDKGTKISIERILEKCQLLLEEYSKRLVEIKNEKDLLEARCNIAIENYLYKENIFDPNGIVPAVPKIIRENNLHTTEVEQLEVIEVQPQVQEPQVNSEEQDRRKELLKSIKASQQELEELRKLEISQDALSQE